MSLAGRRREEEQAIKKNASKEFSFGALSLVSFL